MTGCFCLAAMLAVLFSIEPGDTRRFRIHGSRDETPATYEMMRELAREVRRITGVKVDVLDYAAASAGDFYVSTQPWAAKAAYTYGVRNGVMGFHGSDVLGTEAALRHFIDHELKPKKAGSRLEWNDLRVNEGPQWGDVREQTIAAVRAERARENTPEWENELVNYVNVEPARAYSMPLARQADALTDEWPETPYVKSLNGCWRYNWCGAPAQRPRDFWRTDYDDSNWYEIDVPSCVELKGFGVPIYTNIPYPHPATPPKLDPDYNPVSSYRTTFTVPDDWRGRNVYLRFEGVYSGYYVWVNGKRVGYSEDSCTAHEFNITPYLHQPPAVNLLAVEVYRWSDGSYLEDQDYFRYSGIYRNVMIFATPKAEIWDFHAKTDLANGYRDGVIDLAVETRGEKAPVSAALYDAEFRKVCDVAVGGRTLVRNARLWSAEKPVLYTLVIQNGADIRSCKLGFKKIEETPTGAVLVNGRKIKFKGVNRHDASPVNGRSVTRDEIRRDIELMKRYNIDTIRTAHYPNDPYFYFLCDRYGIYVQAEANVESHGMKYGVKCLASPPSWTEAHVARCRDMVINWRNCPCVFSWSWGNEAGQGPTFDVVQEICRPLDPTRPMVYRQDCERFGWDGPCYPSLASVRDRANWRKPQFFFEYAHGMGNAIGSFKETWDLFYENDSLIGGCIWDWIDQAVWKETDRLDAEGRRERYLAYGGDHDEANDGNFCCNGIIDAERHVTPKLIEVGHVHRNLAVSRRADGAFELRNHFGFTRADEFDGRWELLEDGVVIRTGSLSVPPVEPLARGVVTPGDLPAFRPDREYFVNFAFSLKADTLWAPKGWVVARDQVQLQKPTPWTPSRTTRTPRISQEASVIVAEVGPTRAVFSRTTGTLCELTTRGRTVLKDADGVVHGPRLTVMRALTDNDVWMRGREANPVEKLGFETVYQSGLTQLRYHVRELKVVDQAVRAVVEVNGAKSAGFLHTAVYRLTDDGQLVIENEVKPFGRLPAALPRLGLSMMLEGDYENLEYYGRGPYENYVDRCAGSFVGRYRSTVTGQYVDYIRPQDNGYKTDVRWLKLSSDDGAAVMFSGSVPFFAQALHYGWEDLEFARHRNGQQRLRNMKPPRREVCLNLDIRQTGLGGGSCGPKPEPENIFRIGPEKWTLIIAPEK